MDFKNWALQLVEEHKNPLVRFEIEKTKLFLPSGDEEEGNILVRRIESFKRVLQSHRVERRCARNKIKWLLEDDIGVVEKSVGIKHKFMGFQNKNGRFVHPEEAFFLLETNRAEILYNDMPLNMDQAFAVILRTKEALNKYRIYQKLAVAGYILKKPSTDNKSVKHNSSKILLNMDKLQMDKIEKSEEANLNKVLRDEDESNAEKLCLTQNKVSAKEDQEKSNKKHNSTQLKSNKKHYSTQLNSTQNAGENIEIDKYNQFEPPAKKIKPNNKELQLENVRNNETQNELLVDQINPQPSVSQNELEEKEKFREIFLKLQAKGPKPNKHFVDKPCDYKVELNTTGKSKQGSLHFILDGELDPGIGFYKEDDLNIYCNATTDVIFTRISSVELPNLF